MRSELGRARGGADVNAQQEEAERPKGLSAAFSLISRGGLEREETKWWGPVVLKSSWSLLEPSRVYNTQTEQISVSLSPGHLAPSSNLVRVWGPRSTKVIVDPF
jgi:hypothetical protein